MSPRTPPPTVRPRRQSPPSMTRRVRPSNSTNTNISVYAGYASNNSVKSKPKVSVVRQNLPVNRPEDPISLHNFNKGDTAVKIKGVKNYYFLPNGFNMHFSNTWKTMDENSENIISRKKHPVTRQVVQRKNVQLVKFY